MSLNLGVLSAAVTLDDSKYVETLNGLEGKSDSTFGKISRAAISYFTINSIINFGKKAITTYSDLEEATNKFDVVFQGFTAQANNAVKELTESFGQSELSAKQMLSGTGDILTGFGFDRKIALEMSVLSAKLGADLASFSNYAGGAKGATDALTKAMLGETEMAKMLGIVIRQDSDEFKALAEQAKTTGVDIDGSGKMIKVSTDQQATAVAALAMAYGQSSNAIGDYLRSQESIANQTKELKNNIDNLLSSLGEDSSNVFASALQSANKLLTGYSELDDVTKSLINNIGILTGAMIVLGKTGALTVSFNVVKATVALFAHNTLLKEHIALNGLGAASNYKFAMSMKAVSGAAGLAAAGIGLIIGGAILHQKYLRAQMMSEKKAAEEAYKSAVERRKNEQEQANSDNQKLIRLQELEKYNELNNSEMEEAEKLIGELNKRYGHLEVSIDKNNRKLKVSADSWKKMREEQSKFLLESYKEEMRTNERVMRSNATILGKDLWQYVIGDTRSIRNNLNAGLMASNIDERIMFFTRAAEEISKKQPEYSNQIEEILSLAKAQKEVIKNYRKIQLGYDLPKPKPAPEPDNKKRDEAQEKLETLEWKIKFDDSDIDHQIFMLKNKLDGLFSEYLRKNRFKSINDFISADRKDLTEQELKDLEKILNIKKQLNDLEKNRTKEAERQKQIFIDEENAHKLLIKEIEEQKRRTNFDKVLDKLKENKEIEEYNKLIQKEYAKALNAEKKMRADYFNYRSEAMADNEISEEESKKIEELRQAWKKSLTAADDLKEKFISDSPEKEQQSIRKVIGAWSLASLKQLAGDDVNVQILNENKKNNNLLGSIKDIIDTDFFVYI